MFVLAVRTTGSTPIEAFGQTVAEQNGLTGRDLMIVIASEDRTWGISTGGGLNQAISQADLDSVGNTRLAPALAAGDATGGAVATITQLTYAMDPLASTAATTWVTLAARRVGGFSEAAPDSQFAGEDWRLRLEGVVVADVPNLGVEEILTQVIGYESGPIVPDISGRNLDAIFAAGKDRDEADALRGRLREGGFEGPILTAFEPCHAPRHTVLPEESIASLARRFGADPEVLLRANAHVGSAPVSGDILTIPTCT